MRVTGIIRRVDDLGRVVMPKEIRRALRITEGDPMEIFLTEDGIYLKKYNYIQNSMAAISDLKDVIHAEDLKNKGELLEKIKELEVLLATEIEDTP